MKNYTNMSIADILEKETTIGFSKEHAKQSHTPDAKLVRVFRKVIKSYLDAASRTIVGYTNVDDERRINRLKKKIK